MELATEAGAEDIESDPDGYSITTSPGTSAASATRSKGAGFSVRSGS